MLEVLSSGGEPFDPGVERGLLERGAGRPGVRKSWVMRKELTSRKRCAVSEAGAPQGHHLLR